jgi:hypothetical protein
MLRLSLPRLDDLGAHEETYAASTPTLAPHRGSVRSCTASGYRYSLSDSCRGRHRAGAGRPKVRQGGSDRARRTESLPAPAGRSGTGAVLSTGEPPITTLISRPRSNGSRASSAARSGNGGSWSSRRTNQHRHQRRPRPRRPVTQPLSHEPCIRAEPPHLVAAPPYAAHGLGSVRKSG